MSSGSCIIQIDKRHPRDPDCKPDQRVDPQEAGRCDGYKFRSHLRLRNPGAAGKQVDDPPEDIFSRQGCNQRIHMQPGDNKAVQKTAERADHSRHKK